MPTPVETTPGATGGGGAAAMREPDTTIASSLAIEPLDPRMASATCSRRTPEYPASRAYSSACARPRSSALLRARALMDQALSPTSVAIDDLIAIHVERIEPDMVIFNLFV